MNRESFSKGSHASVYVALMSDQVRYSGVEVVRESTEQERFISIAAYLRHGIVTSLHPDNILEYLALEIDEVPYVSYGTDGAKIFTKRYKSRSFSKLAVTPDDHAVFSLHMDGHKDVVCGCGACRRHDSFHREFEVDKKAAAFADEMREIGIFLPSNDETDYCLAGGNIFFFEVEDINSRVLRENIQKMPEREGVIRAVHLLKAYDLVMNRDGSELSGFKPEDFIL